MSKTPSALLGPLGESVGYFRAEPTTAGARFLKECGIEFTGLQYRAPKEDPESSSPSAATPAPASPEASSNTSAPTPAAPKTGVPKTRAFVDRADINEHYIIKTLIFSEPKTSQTVCVLMHGDHRVNTKALAKAAGFKRVVQAPIDLAQERSGYIMGGNSPFGLKTPMPIFVESTILSLPHRIIINAGRHDFYFVMPPSDIVRVFETARAAELGWGKVQEVRCGTPREPTAAEATAATEAPAPAPAAPAAAGQAGSAEKKGESSKKNAGQKPSSSPASTASAAASASSSGLAPPEPAQAAVAAALPASIKTLADLSAAADAALNELSVLSSIYSHSNVDPDSDAVSPTAPAAPPISQRSFAGGMELFCLAPATIAALKAFRDTLAGKSKGELKRAATAEDVRGWPVVVLELVEQCGDSKGLAATATASATASSGASGCGAMDTNELGASARATTDAPSSSATASKGDHKKAAKSGKHSYPDVPVHLTITLPPCYPHAPARVSPSLPAHRPGFAPAPLVGRLGKAAEALAGQGAEAVYELVEMTKQHFVEDCFAQVASTSSTTTTAVTTTAATAAVTAGTAARVNNGATVPISLSGDTAPAHSRAADLKSREVAAHIRAVIMGLPPPTAAAAAEVAAATATGGVEEGAEGDYKGDFVSLLGRLVIGPKGKQAALIEPSSPAVQVSGGGEIEWLGRPKRNIRLGFVGLPNVGKSSLYNLLSEVKVPAENYPFCTIDPNTSKVPVRDPRVCSVAHALRGSPHHTTVDVIDIAGLVAGASRGAGLGNAFLHHISTVHVIFQVVRAFDNESVIHVDGCIDPTRDVTTITAELIAKDLQSMAQRIERACVKLYRCQTLAQEKEHRRDLSVLLKAYEWLVAGKALRHCRWTQDEHAYLSTLQTWTSKPMCLVANMSASDYANPARRAVVAAPLRAWAAAHSPESAVIPLSVTFEEATLRSPPGASTDFVADVAAAVEAAQLAGSGLAAAWAAGLKGAGMGGESAEATAAIGKVALSAAESGSVSVSGAGRGVGAAVTSDGPPVLPPKYSSTLLATATATGTSAGSAGSAGAGAGVKGKVVEAEEAWLACVWACALGPALWEERTPAAAGPAPAAGHAPTVTGGAGKGEGKGEGKGGKNSRKSSLNGSSSATSPHAAAAAAATAAAGGAAGDAGWGPREGSALMNLISEGYKAWEMVPVYAVDGNDAKTFLVRRGYEACRVAGLLNYDFRERCTGVQVYPYAAFVAANYSLKDMRANHTRLIKKATYPVQEHDILQFTIKD